MANWRQVLQNLVFGPPYVAISSQFFVEFVQVAVPGDVPLPKSVTKSTAIPSVKAPKSTKLIQTTDCVQLGCVLGWAIRYGRPSQSQNDSFWRG